jgi:hypothetical protein
MKYWMRVNKKKNPTPKKALQFFLNYRLCLLHATAVAFTAAMATRSRVTLPTAAVFILEIIYGRLDCAVS